MKKYYFYILLFSYFSNSTTADFTGSPQKCALSLLAAVAIKSENPLHCYETLPPAIRLCPNFVKRVHVFIKIKGGFLIPYKDYNDSL